MATNVSVGKFGDIKKLMRQLSKREAYVDLELVCNDGSLFCHKFIIGAQSRFLRQIMLNVNDEEICRILLPDVPKQHMEIVLKFLYTGRLGITASVKNIVRELLEDILRIDAKINLPPDTPPLASTPSAPKRPPDSDQDGNGSQHGHGANQNGDQSSGLEKRSRTENSCNDTSSNPGLANGFASSARSYHYPTDLPLSPPHCLESDFLMEEEDDDVVFIESRPGIKTPTIVDLYDSDNEIKTEAPDELPESNAAYDEPIHAESYPGDLLHNVQVDQNQEQISVSIEQEQTQESYLTQNSMTDIHPILNRLAAQEHPDQISFVQVQPKDQAGVKKVTNPEENSSEKRLNLAERESYCSKNGLNPDKDGLDTLENGSNPVEEELPLPTIVSFRSGPFNPMSDLHLSKMFPSSPEIQSQQEPEVVPEITAEPALPLPGSSPAPKLGQAASNPEKVTPREVFIDVDHADEPDTAPQASTSTIDDVWSGSIAPAPSIIAKKTSQISQSHPSSSAVPKIVKAPRMMAKSTGGFFARPSKRGRGSVLGSRSSSPSVHHPDISGNVAHVQSTSTFQPGNINFSSQDQGQLEDQRPIEGQQIPHLWLSGFDSMIAEASFHYPKVKLEINENGVPLLPPIPVPPEAGYVIRRGKWAKANSGRGIRNTGVHRETGIRKHHYSPYTITGKMYSTTLATLSEPEGVHLCVHCPAKFNKLASLDKHLRRVHNPNLTVQCPECPKMLSCKAAIKKHLLSHRPETEWPYECPFCFKRFQAKGDLPKHFFTSQHKNDLRIPAPGSLEWHQLLNSCCVIPDWVMPTKRKVKKQTAESYSENLLFSDVQIEIIDEIDNPEIENSATVANSNSAHLPKTGPNSTETCQNENFNVIGINVNENSHITENRQNENSNWLENCETSNLSENLIAAQAENETSQAAHENPFSILNILTPNQITASSAENVAENVTENVTENAATLSKTMPVKQIFIKRDIDEDEFVFCTTDEDGCPL